MSNYALEVVRARQERDAAIVRARANALRQAARDREIRQLPTWNPDRAAYNRRRREIAQQRDGAIDSARAEARRRIAEATARRDREIRQLRASDPLLRLEVIAANVGCSRSQVFESLYPQRRVAYRRRRWDIEHGRLRAVS